MKINKQPGIKKNNLDQMIKQIKRNKEPMIPTDTIQTGNKKVKKVKMILVNQSGNKKPKMTGKKRTARGRNQKKVNPVKRL